VRNYPAEVAELILCAYIKIYCRVIAKCHCWSEFYR